MTDFHPPNQPVVVVWVRDVALGRRVVFRSNPGWDGPTPPSMVVRLVDHLSRAGAPCPSVIPTVDGLLSTEHGAFTFSLESFLEGEVADRVFRGAAR